VTTSLHPGHIVGPGWQPIGPLGNLDQHVWSVLASGEPLAVPGSGAEMMHHVHADDVAQAFELAVSRRDAVAGEDLNIVAPTALSVRGFAAIAAAWFGQEARLRPVSWEAFRASTPAEHAEASWGHLDRSQCFTIEKARRLLDYAPRYEPEAAVLESVRWLIDHDELDPGAPLLA
jgi:nucleoside-diphosphate-sugar epimerase